MKGGCIRRLNGFRIYIFFIASGLRDRESQELFCREGKGDCSQYDIGLVFKEITSYSDQDKLKFIENVWKPGELFDFPSSVECSNSNCHFVWSWLKRIPWLAYSIYLDGAFCLPCVFFGVQCGRNTNKLDKLYKSPLTLWTSAISRVTKQASGKCEMHNLADLNLNSHAILARLV